MASHFSCRRNGFSLIEILAVILIISIALSMGIYSFKNMMRSVDLNTSSATLSDTLNMARQIALSSNRPVEVRFYKVPRKDQPASTPASDWVYRALALYIINDSGPEQTGKISFLSGDVQLASTKVLGPLLFYATSAQSSLKAIDPSGATQFEYRSVIFRSDGSTTLDDQTPEADTWHCMLFNTTQSPLGDQPPKNFITIQLDPSTGRSETFQP